MDSNHKLHFLDSISNSSVLSFLASLQGLCSIYAQLKDSAEIWAGLTHKIWYCLSLVISFLGFSPYFPVTMITPNFLLWLFRPERQVFYHTFSHHVTPAAAWLNLKAVKWITFSMLFPSAGIDLSKTHLFILFSISFKYLLFEVLPEFIVGNNLRENIFYAER